MSYSIGVDLTFDPPPIDVERYVALVNSEACTLLGVRALFGDVPFTVEPCRVTAPHS